MVEWRLTGAEAPGTGTKTHPYHQHMTHFQVVDVRMQGPAKAEHAPRRGLAKLVMAATDHWGMSEGGARAARGSRRLARDMLPLLWPIATG